MTRKHLGTVLLALAALTLAPPWPAAALAQTTFTVAGGLNLASVAVSADEGVTPESVTRLAIGVSAGIPMSEGFGTSPGCRLLAEGLRCQCLRRGCHHGDRLSRAHRAGRHAVVAR